MNSNSASSLPLTPVICSTVLWVVALAVMLLASARAQPVIDYATFRDVRRIGTLVVVVLALGTLLLAVSRTLGPAALVWWTSPTLVSFALFWGLFPPSWFFIEYLAVDNGSVVISDLSLACKELEVSNCSVQAAKQALLIHVDKYADLAAKFWAAVGAALGLIVGLGGKR